MGINDRPCIRERLACASISDDLELRESYCDLDKVAAAGLVGMSESLAIDLIRLKYANGVNTYQGVLEQLTTIVRQEARRAKWKSGVNSATDDEICGLAECVLNVWLIDCCIDCAGRGHSVMAGAPILSDDICERCGGTGRRKLDRRELESAKITAGARWLDHAKWLLDLLTDSERRAGALALRKLRPPGIADDGR